MVPQYEQSHEGIYIDEPVYYRAAGSADMTQPSYPTHIKTTPRDWTGKSADDAQLQQQQKPEGRKPEEEENSEKVLYFTNPYMIDDVERKQ